MASEQELAERNKKFWIIPGSFVTHRLYPGVVMSVKEVSAVRLKEVVGECPYCSEHEGGHKGVTPYGQWCEKGMLVRWRNRTNGVLVHWLDSFGRKNEATFQVKELMQWVDPDGKKAPNNT